MTSRIDNCIIIVIIQLMARKGRKYVTRLLRIYKFISGVKRETDRKRERERKRKPKSKSRQRGARKPVNLALYSQSVKRFK